MNSVQLIGNITMEPKEETSKSGAKYVKLSIAVNGRRKVKDTWEDTVTYVNFSVFGKAADNAVKFLAKGLKVAATGELSNYKDKDGHTVLQFQCTNLEYLQFRNKDREADNASDKPSYPNDEVPF